MHRVRRLPIKNPAFAGLVFLVIVVLIVTLFVRLVSTSCSEGYRDDENVNIDDQTIHLQVAKTSTELVTGLGGKRCISADQAMLFDLGQSGQHRIWMKNMQFPIDIVWLNSKQEVIQVNSNISPKTYPETFTSVQPSSYVLEMQSGRAAQLDIGAGTLIKV